ncbi:MAG: carboxypeptidase-like regulatory domain-containing protein [Planctomycetota bacterium]
MKSNSLLSVAALVVVPTNFARADFLDGRVLNHLGQGVAGVDIDARDGNGDVGLVNGGTDANGFFHVTIPAGTFEITFNPPQPPASTGLITVVDPVVVSGTTNMGNVTLTQGVSVSGRLLNPSAVGVPAVNIDVLDADGDSVDLLYDDTDAAGNFSVAVPLGSIELRFDTTTVIGQTLAPKALALNLSSNTSLGDLSLAQGFVVTAIVRRPGAVPVADCDLDVRDLASGEKLYTPSDNTNAAGFVDTIVPGGTLHFDFCPPFALQLAAARVGPLVIAANTNLGTVNLVAGVVLSGTIRDFTNATVANADVDVANATSGVEVVVCDDNSGATGAYQIVVPTGTFTIRFSPPPSSALGSDFHYNVAVNANTVRNGVLPQGLSTFCYGDGSLATPCPCVSPNTVPNPSGAAGNGCANSFNLAGAKLRAGGTTAPDTLEFTTDVAVGYVGFAFLVKGNAQDTNGIAAADGVRCAAGQLVRFGAHNAGTNGAPIGTWTYPNAVQTTPVSTATAQGAGTAYYQLFYRNTAPGFCSSGTTNFSNGVQASW